jgi:hypothetical protein
VPLNLSDSIHIQGSILVAHQRLASPAYLASFVSGMIAYSWMPVAINAHARSRPLENIEGNSFHRGVGYSLSDQGTICAWQTHPTIGGPVRQERGHVVGSREDARAAVKTVINAQLDLLGFVDAP